MARYRDADRMPPAARRTVAGMALAGAVVAAPLATALPASAASESTWDAVAQCESNGDWHIDTGNGFSGGLQFSSSTWASFGGTEYAPTAADASRQQQIAVAERVLQQQGPSAWPVCSEEAGLTAGPLENQDVSSGSGASARGEDEQAGDRQAGLPPQQSAPASGETYTVRNGDTLSKIGARFGVSWQSILEDNKDVLHGADLILPGQQLQIG